MAYVLGQLYNVYRTYVVEYSGKKSFLKKNEKKKVPKVLIESKF